MTDTERVTKAVKAAMGETTHIDASTAKVVIPLQWVFGILYAILAGLFVYFYNDFTKAHAEAEEQITEVSKNVAANARQIQQLTALMSQQVDQQRRQIDLVNKAAENAQANREDLILIKAKLQVED